MYSLKVLIALQEKVKHDITMKNASMLSLI